MGTYIYICKFTQVFQRKLARCRTLHLLSHDELTRAANVEERRMGQMFENSPSMVYNRHMMTSETCRKAAEVYDKRIRASEPGTLEHYQATQAWFAWIEDAEKAERAISKLIANYA